MNEGRMQLARLATMWPPLRGPRLEEIESALRREPGGFTITDVKAAVDTVIGTHTGQFPPAAGDVLDAARHHRTTRRDQERDHHDDTPDPGSDLIAVTPAMWRELRARLAGNLRM